MFHGIITVPLRFSTVLLRRLEFVEKSLYLITKRIQLRQCVGGT